MKYVVGDNKLRKSHTKRIIDGRKVYFPVYYAIPGYIAMLGSESFKRATEADEESKKLVVKYNSGEDRPEILKEAQSGR